MDLDPHGPGLILVGMIRIRIRILGMMNGKWIQEGKNDPQENFRNLMFFLRVELSVLRAEGFSSSLDVLHGVQGIKKLQFLIKNRFFSDCKILQFCHLNPESGSCT